MPVTRHPGSTVSDYSDDNLVTFSIYVLLSRHGLGVPSALNRATVLWLLAHGILHACMDNRFPTGGSNHQKAVVFKHPSGSSSGRSGHAGTTRPGRSGWSRWTYRSR